ncbi:MAG: aminotransferase class V-fold PLP-dependent enzyme [Acidimicrobiaceae bacterium]|nr:aminotransferase class V-fold PLP-dependent enzyme [Acidimicrobiaceae bacterium]
MRSTEYGRLDDEDQVYLDYTGGGLYADGQLRAHFDLLRRRVLGNPHSNNPTSLAMTELVEGARRSVLEFFDADEHVCIFTPNASGALKLVGESYPFAAGGRFALTADNHNSVNGIREFARRAGAEVTYVPVTAPELRLDRVALGATLAMADPDADNLFAFPAQSNYSGVQHPLAVIDEAHDAGWDVLVDAAAFAPTNRLDLREVPADFVTLSFYKMFGYPTGLGCLIARRDALARLQRPWFAGGTITIASVQGDGHYLHDDEAGFEDGTVDYLNIPGVEIGLRHLQRLGIDRIHERVRCLTAWLLDALGGLRHANGAPVVQLFGPAGTDARGGTITLLMRDPDGRPIDDRRVEELANRVGISLRTGCFCNPGAGEVAHGLTEADMRGWFGRDRPVSFLELRSEMLASMDLLVSAVRVSVGLATNVTDVFRLMCFVQGFVDRTVDDIGRVEFVSDNCRIVRDTA